MAAPTVLTYGTNIDETLTLSMVNLIPGIKDNVFNSNDALQWFYETGKKKIKGGVSLSHGIRYGKNNQAASYQRYDTLGTQPQDNLLRDQWSWAQYGTPMTIDGFTERVANAGDKAIENALEEKREEAILSLRDLLEQHIFAASPGSKDIRSLPVIVLASGTEGQINGSTSTWWQSNVVAAGSWAAGIGRTKLTNMINTCTKRNPTGLPQLLLSDQASYEAYEGQLVAQYRYTDDKPDIGTSKLTFKQIPWVWSVQGTSGVIYALTKDAIEFIVNTDTDFIVKPFQQPVNQDARVGHILLACCLSTGIRRKLGKTTGNAA